jgi:hypothetical protein
MYKDGVLEFVMKFTTMLLHLLAWLGQIFSFHVFFCIFHLRFMYIVLVFCKSSFSYQLSYGCDDCLLATCSVVLEI